MIALESCHLGIRISGQVIVYTAMGCAGLTLLVPQNEGEINSFNREESIAKLVAKTSKTWQAAVSRLFIL